MIKIEKIKNIKEISNNYIENNEKIKEFILKEKWENLCENVYKKLYNEVFLDYFKGEIIYLKVLNSSSKHYVYTNKNIILEKIKSEVDFEISDIKINLY